jgi:hypothetical protein
MLCLCLASHSILASCVFCCLLILLSHHPCSIILSRPLSHLITHHQRWRAPRASSRRNVFLSYSPPTLTYISPILVSPLVTQVGCHPDRPSAPAFPPPLSIRLAFAESSILATHQPAPSFFPFFLRLSAFVFSNPVVTVSYYRPINLFCNRVW